MHIHAFDLSELLLNKSWQRRVCLILTSPHDTLSDESSQAQFSIVRRDGGGCRNWDSLVIDDFLLLRRVEVRHLSILGAILSLLAKHLIHELISFHNRLVILTRN